MLIYRSSFPTLVGVIVGVLLLAGCADKTKAKAPSDTPPPPSTWSRLKNMVNWETHTAPKANVTNVISGTRGHHFATDMDYLDFEKLNEALEKGRSRQTISWRNPSSGHQFGITPLPVFQDNIHRYCRELTIESLVKGQEESVRTVACRRGDGIWDVQG